MVRDDRDERFIRDLLVAAACLPGIRRRPMRITVQTCFASDLLPGGGGAWEEADKSEESHVIMDS